MSRQPYARLVVNHSQNCNMHCTWCHEEGMQRTSTTTELKPHEIVAISTKLFVAGFRKFKIVGGEPTLRSDLPEIIGGIRNLGPDIDLSMMTNGSRLHALASTYKDAGLNRVNVSLFTLNKTFFGQNVGKTSLMAKVDSGIRTAKQLGILGKINHVYQSNEELRRVLDYAHAIGVRVNVLNRIPSIGSDDTTPIEELLAILKGLPVQTVHIEDDPNSLPVTVMRLVDSTEIEVKHLELGEQHKFRSCMGCAAKPKCKEGIFAVRVTPAGVLQPCIVRDDNTIDARTSSAQEIRHFVEHL